MYTGPIKKEPRHPRWAEIWTDGGPAECSRKQYLEERDQDRRYDAETARCNKRRRHSGFEKIDDMRYGGGTNDK